MNLIRSLAVRINKYLAQVDSRGWWPFVSEPYAGAWQNNDSWTIDNVLAHPTVYACVTLIANDIGKLPSLLVKEGRGGIWTPYKDQKLETLLKRPNRYQNHIQFKTWWIMSELVHGNTYALKARDNYRPVYSGPSQSNAASRG
jgi:phage portal protein BeeE